MTVTMWVAEFEIEEGGGLKLSAFHTKDQRCPDLDYDGDGVLI